MSRRARLSETARADLIELIQYLAERNPAAARRVRESILAALDRIGERPGIGHRRSDLTDRDVRFLTVRRRFLLCYQEEGGAVRVLRVFGPGRDVASLL